MKSISLLVTLLIVPALASAFSMKQFKKDILTLTPAVKIGKTTTAKHKAAPAPAPKCTNFTGNWKGSCKSDQGTEQVAINITQSGCTSFTEGIPDLVGKIESGTSVDSDGIHGTWLNIDWDKDNKALFWTYNLTESVPGQKTNIAGTILRAMTVENNSLVMQTQGLYMGMQDGQAGSGEINEECTLTK